MAGLAYDYRWNPLTANFSNSNSMYGAASAALSGVGDIFSKLADRVAAREAKRQELELRTRELDMKDAQFGLGQELEREKLAQALAIAQMDDETRKAQIAASNRRWDIEERQMKAEAEAWRAARKKAEEAPNKFLSETERLNAEKAKLMGKYGEDQQKLKDLLGQEQFAKSMYDVAPDIEKNRPFFGFMSLDDISRGDLRAAGITPDGGNIVRENFKMLYDAMQGGRQELENEMNSPVYQQGLQAALERVKPIDSELERITADNILRQTPQGQALSYLDEVVARGGSPIMKNLPAPIQMGLDIIEAQNRPSGSKSGSSGKSGGSGGGHSFMESFSASKADIDDIIKPYVKGGLREMSESDRDRLFALAEEEYQRAGGKISGKLALELAAARFDQGRLWDSWKRPINTGF